MLFVVIPAIVGIILASHFAIPVVVLCCAIGLSTLGALYARPRGVAYGFVVLLVTLFGALLVLTRQSVATTPYDRAVEMQIGIVSPIAERAEYSVAEGRIEGWCEDGVWHDAEERVQLWLRTDMLRYGDRAHIVGQLRERISKYGDYDALMHNRGYVGGVAVSEWQILDVKHDVAGGLRRYAIEKVERYVRDSASHSVVEGMVVGARYGMPKALRDAYSVTGLSHILAVSGLHLGIIVLVISMLLKPLKLIHHGHIIADILTVVILWLFVAISGASPSVVRAALMFSVLILVKNSTAHYNPLNALSFAIFMMLCYNPQTLYDISFQLSVLAVLGIVAWGVPIVRNIRFKSHLATSVISTFVIGVVATLWTLPIVSATFDNIPIVGVVATPVVLVTAYAIVGCGVMTLILPHPVAQYFALCAEWMASVQNIVVEWFASLPFASVQHTLSASAIAIYYTLFAIVTLLIWSRKPKKKSLSFSLSQFEG